MKDEGANQPVPLPAPRGEGGRRPGEGRPSSRHALPLALVAALLLFTPALFVGFGIETFWLLALDGPNGVEPYRMVHGEPAARAFWARLGLDPWWADPGFRWALWRPVSNALLLVERQLFGSEAIGWHALSLGVYLALVAAVWPLYRRFLGPAAGVALLVFATHFSHMQPVWLWSDQHSVLATLSVVLGLAAYVRGREDGWRPGGPLAVVAVAAGLAFGETAVGMAGFFLAYEAFGRRDPAYVRARALGPVAALIVAYVLAHGALGYGVAGNGFYLDPRAETAAYLAALPARLAASWAGVMGVLPAELWMRDPARRPLLVGSGVVAAAQVLFLLRRAPSNVTALPWLSVGAVLTLLPALANFPGGRLLLPATIGGAALVGTIAHTAWTRFRGQDRLALAVAAPLLFAAAAWPLVAPLQLVDLRRTTTAVTAAALDADVADAEDVVVLTMPGALLALHLLPARVFEGGHPLPASWQTISAAPYDHVLRRPAADVLELEVIGGAMLEHDRDRLFRSASDALVAGFEADRGHLRVRVLDAAGGLPTRVAVTFARPLDDPRLRIVAWQEGRLARVALPPVGGELRIPWSAGPFPRGM